MHIDSTDIGMSDNFLVWLEQQRILGNRSVQLDGGGLISLVMMLLEKSTVKQGLVFGFCVCRASCLGHSPSFRCL